MGFDGNVEVSTQPRQHNMRIAHRDTQIAELGTRAIASGRNDREQIVGAPVLALGGRNPWLLDENVRDHYSAMAQQFHRVDGHRQPIHHGQGNVLRETLGVGDPHSVCHRHSLPAEPQVEMLQRNRATECGRCLMRNQRAKPVPVPHRRQNTDGQDRPAQHEWPTPTPLALSLEDRAWLVVLKATRRCRL